MAKPKAGETFLKYKPEPKQALLHNSVFQQCLYGGAAGGMKSHTIRWDLIQWCISVPGIECYLFRKTFSQLDDNHIRPIQRELPLEIAHFNVSKSRFEFFNESKILMCHCDSIDDYLKYMGAEMHVAAIDEAGLLQPIQIIEIRGRVRLGAFAQRVPDEFKEFLPRFLLSSNPGGPSHNFIKRTFITPSAPFKIFYDNTLIDPRKPGDQGWKTMYIPARMEDNPHLDSNYGSVFSAMSPERAKALREGDWDAVEGAALHLLSRARHMVRPFTIPPHWTRFTSLDWGTAVPFSMGWYAVAGEDTIIKDTSTGFPQFLDALVKSDRVIPQGAVIRYEELYGWTGKENEGLRLASGTVAKLILDVEKERKIGHPTYRIADSAMWAQFDGPSPAERMMMSTEGKIILSKCKKDRQANYDEINCRLAGNPFLKDDGKVADPMFFITSNCIQAWRTLPILLLDTLHPDKGPGEDGENHVYDEIAYALASRPMTTTKQQSDYEEYQAARRAVKKQTDAYSTI